MRTYIAVVHKDPDSSSATRSPDLPGCFSAADDAESIDARAQEALALYLRDLDELPRARSIEDLRSDPDVAADIAAGALLLAVPIVAANSPKERVNVMLDRSLLEGLDRSAGIVGISRSEYIARSVSSTLQRESGIVVLRAAGTFAGKKAVASAAAKTLGSKSASPAAKKVAASALTQTKSKKEVTGPGVASAAAKILHDPKASKAEKTVAASALTQKPGKKK